MLPKIKSRNSKKSIIRIDSMKNSSKPRLSIQSKDSKYTGPVSSRMSVISHAEGVKFPGNNGVRRKSRKLSTGINLVKKIRELKLKQM